MCRILLLTKCVFAEQELEEKIRQLGHEVLSSTSLLKSILQDRLPECFLQEFQIVLLSESITNGENLAVVEKLQDTASLIVQLSEKNHQEEQKKSAVTAYLSPKAALEDIREMLYLGESKKPSYPSGQEILQRLSLTKREQKLLQELVRAENKVLSQEQLAQQIWNKEHLDNSAKCQMSTLIRKIRDKMEYAGYDSSLLQTARGEGYVLRSN